MPWNPIETPVVLKLMKAALDHGANLWNGVRALSRLDQRGLSSVHDTTH